MALTEGALEGLPQTRAHGGNGHAHCASYILELPADHSTPYRFVELDWNPKGHGGPYTAQHFDVHFYRISLEEHSAATGEGRGASDGPALSGQRLAGAAAAQSAVHGHLHHRIVGRKR